MFSEELFYGPAKIIVKKKPNKIVVVTISLTISLLLISTFWVHEDLLTDAN